MMSLGCAALAALLAVRRPAARSLHSRLAPPAAAAGTDVYGKDRRTPRRSWTIFTILIMLLGLISAGDYLGGSRAAVLTTAAVLIIGTVTRLVAARRFQATIKSTPARRSPPRRRWGSSTRSTAGTTRSSLIPGPDPAQAAQQQWVDTQAPVPVGEIAEEEGEALESQSLPGVIRRYQRLLDNRPGGVVTTLNR
jgi:hypothetical protein